MSLVPAEAKSDRPACIAGDLFRRVTRVHGPQAGLDALSDIAARRPLESYHLFHAVRGTLAAELGRFAEAIVCFRRARDLAVLPSERAFIARRIQECEESPQLTGARSAARERMTHPRLPPCPVRECG